MNSIDFPGKGIAKDTLKPYNYLQDHQGYLTDMNRFENINSTIELRKRLRHMILSGEISPGTRLPGARTLAEDCGIHYQTINRIYHELGEQGFVEIRQGAGTIALHPDFTNIRLVALLEDPDSNERSHLYYQDVFIKAVKEKQNKLGVNIDFLHMKPGKQRSKELLRLLEPYDGAIAVLSRNDTATILNHSSIPVISYLDNRQSSLSSITNDSAATAYMATRHLIEAGCRKIGLIVRDMNMSSISKKLVGYVCAMRDAGLSIEPDYIWELKVKSQFFQVLQQINNHIKNNRLLDGYVCTGSNEGAILLSCLQRDGVKIPEQVKIVGYDEIEGCPDMTRIILPRRQCAHRCIEWLLEHLGNPTTMEQEFIPSELHIGNTTITVKYGGKKCEVS